VRYSFDRHEGLIIVRAEVFGPSGSIVVRLALDTGATSTTVNAGLLNAIGYDPALVPDCIQLTTGSAVEYAPRLSVNKIETLGQERVNFLVVAHALPPTAVLMACWAWTFSAARNSILTFARESSC
jgi:predicted aspartyl protease